MFEGLVLPVNDEMAAATERSLRQISAPGTWLTGAERVAVAAAARDALEGRIGMLRPVRPELAEAAESVAVAADEIAPAWLADLDGRGLDGLTMVEIIGVAARTAAIDTLARGIGVEPPPFFEPEGGAPSREVAGTVGFSNAWLPTDGPASAPTALSAVPIELAAQDDIHSAYYLPPARMGELDFELDGLHRTQMELAASRTSLLNNCFY